MRVLIACEYSGRVREAFRRRGHGAVSCDFEPAEDGSPHHYRGDVFDLLENPHQRFDLMIAHPPCTYLCNSGVRWLYEKPDHFVTVDSGETAFVNHDRWQQMREASAFFAKLLQAPVPKIAVENPIMHRYGRQRIAEILGHEIKQHFVQPWWFGEPAFKATGFTLKGLTPLVEDHRLTLRAILPKPGTPEHKKWSQVHNASPSPTRWKERSRTYQGIADAMASQWG